MNKLLHKEVIKLKTGHIVEVSLREHSYNDDRGKVKRLSATAKIKTFRGKVTD